MREYRTVSEIRLERLVRGLSVFTFVLFCWTLNRVMRPRENCVTSDYLGAVLIEGHRIDNCAFESRLKIGGPQLTKIGLERLRKLEDTASLVDWFRPNARLLIEITEREPRAFALYKGALRLGSAWVDEGSQVRRALAMAILKTRPGFADASHFQIETLADFVVLSAYGNARWTDRRGGAHDFARDVRLATAAPTFAGYCKSPYRSLAHDHACRANAMPDAQGPVWSLRPVLASALARTYGKLGLKQKMRVIAAIREGVHLPKVSSPAGASADALVLWFTKTLRDHAGALQMLTDAAADVAVRDSLRELDVESPTRWEVTFDLRNTPRWREILTQLEGRAKFRPRERALVFTPEGEIALPSGLPVAWAVRDVESRKHVMIACHLPTAGEAVGVRAQSFFARRTCETLANSFWD